MKLGQAVMIAAGLVGGAWFLSGHPDVERAAHAAPHGDEMQNRAVETFRLTANGDEASCSVTRHNQVSQGRSELSLDPDCIRILPDITRAKFWQEEPDGSVIFTENGVDPIVTFAVADGVAFESVQPQAPLISLDVAQ